MSTSLKHAGGSKAAERRRHGRLAMSQPVKLVVCDLGRYLSGRTANVSSGGALLEIDHPSLLVPGQWVRVGIAWSPRQTVLLGSQLSQATVVRSLGHGGSQSVAVSFVQPQALPALAESA